MHQFDSRVGKIKRSESLTLYRDGAKGKKFMTTQKSNMFWKHIAFMNVGEDERQKNHERFCSGGGVLPI
jgi:hypothetical protein